MAQSPFGKQNLESYKLIHFLTIVTEVIKKFLYQTDFKSDLK